METLFLIVTVAGFAFFAGVMLWAEAYTRDVRAKWEPRGAGAAAEPVESVRSPNPAVPVVG